MRDLPFRAAVACVLALAFPGLTGAAENLTPSPRPLNDPVAGAALAAELRDLRPATNAEWRGVMTVRRRDRPTTRIPIVSRIRVGRATWDTTYEARGTTGSETLKVVRAAGAPNEYHLARGAAGTDGASPPPLPRAEIWQPFAGSDFALGDLGLEFLHWPTQTLLQHEMRKNRACHVLESRPAPGAAPYARVLSWVDVESGGILLAEAYGADGRRLKEFEVNGIKKTGDQWRVQKMEIRHLSNRSRTVLEFDVPAE